VLTVNKRVNRLLPPNRTMDFSLTPGLSDLLIHAVA